MYPSEPTLTEELNKFIEENKPLDKDIIKEYIDSFDTSQMDLGEKYYYKENDITKNVIYAYDQNGQKYIDDEATNNKYASGKSKLLVDQKTGYLVSDAITVGYKDESDITPLIELLGEEFHDVLPELVTSASNKGIEWLHPYIDPEGEFDYLVVSAQEFIPIYDNSKRKNLTGGIRFYPTDHDDIIKVEFWDEQTVKYYEIVEGKINEDYSNGGDFEESHFYYGDEGYGWGKVPFIPFKNNEKEVPDIHFYKDFIDIYDKLMSKGANTLEEIQEFIYILKGYTDSDWNEVLANLKRYKGANVDGEGGLDILQGEMPMSSLGEYLDRVVDDIYHDGQGVNLATDKFGQSPSGIALKFLFSNLDMKANVLERKFIKALKLFMWFVCEYASIAGIGDFDNNKVTFTFNKSMLMNDFEQSQIAMNSKGIISDETIRENHPWVSDSQTENERMEKQRAAYPSIEDVEDGQSTED